MEMKFSLILHCVKKVFMLLLDNSDECSGLLENGYTEVTHWAMPSPVAVLVTALHVLCCRALLLFLGCTLLDSPSCLGRLVSVCSEVGRLEPKTEVQIQTYLYCKLEVLPHTVHKSILLLAFAATLRRAPHWIVHWSSAVMLPFC